MPDTILKPEELQPAAELIGDKTLENQLDRILLGRKELHPAGADWRAGPRTCLAGRVAGLGQDRAGPHGRPHSETGFQTYPVHARPHARRRFGDAHFAGNQLRQARIGISTRAGLHEHFARGRNQPCLAQKTQSAYGETMQERCSGDAAGHHPHVKPQPFFALLASQNPIELEGTYPLPRRRNWTGSCSGCCSIVVNTKTVLEQIISERRRGEPPASTGKWKRAN